MLCAFPRLASEATLVRGPFVTVRHRPLTSTESDGCSAPEDGV